MTFATAIRALGPVDVRSVRRDGMLAWMVFLPLLTALVVRYGLPALTRRLRAAYAFDLSPYDPAIVTYFVLMLAPVMFGALIGFLLLDERDDDTLTALQVTPLTLRQYVTYRLVVPIVLSIALMFVTFPLAGTRTPGPLGIAISALAAAPIAPLFALFLGSMANNKVQGFALAKLSGVVIYAPLVAFFIESRWELAFGIVPTYWAMRVYWLVDAGEPGILPHLAVALVYPSLLAVAFARRLYAVTHR